MTAMANNAGAAPQQQQLMYYYVAVPGPNAAQQYGVQGQEGMNTGQFDGSQQVPFGVPQQGGYGGYGDQDAANVGGVGGMQMGMPPAMMAPTGQGGQMVPGAQMMLVTTMMQPGVQGGQQAPTGMDQPPDSSAGSTAWGGGMQSQQAPHDSSSQPPQSATRTPTDRSKAFKIVNPHTHEEIKSKEGHDGQPGGGGGQQAAPSQGSGGCGQQPQQPQQSPQQQPQQQPGMQQPVWGNQPPSGFGGAPQSGGQQPSQQTPPQQPQQQQQPPPQQPQQQMPQGTQQQTPNPGASPQPAQTGPKRKGLTNMKLEKTSGPTKGLKLSNMKLEKPTKPAADAASADAAASKSPEPPTTSPAAAGASASAAPASAPAAGSAASAASPVGGEKPGDADSKASAAPAAAEAKAATEGSKTSGGSASGSAAPSPEPSQRKPGGGGESGSGGGGGGGGGSAGGGSSHISSRWPGVGSGGPSMPFVSSIKALNLEPMRANPQPYRAKPAPVRPTGPSSPELPQTQASTGPSAQQQTSSQQQQQQQQQQQSPQQQQQAPQQQQQAQQQQQPQQQQQQQVPQQQPQQQQPPQQPQQPQQQQPPQMQQQPPPQQMQQMQPPQQMPQMGHSPQMPQMGHPGQMGQMPHMQMAPMMQQQGMPPMMMQGQVPMQHMGQVQQPPQPPPPAPMKSKGIKLKNAAMVRLKPRASDDNKDDGRDDGQGGDNKDDSKEASEAPSPMVPSTMPVQQEAAVRRLSLKPADCIFDRLLMLRIWRSHKHELHAAVSGLHTNDRPGEKSAQPHGTPTDRPRKPGGRDRGGRADDGPSERLSVFGTEMKTNKKKEPALKVSEKAYRIQEPTKREDEIERRVRSLLNKICPDNLKTIVDRLALIELHKADELEFVIRIIFGKALAEPHYCETYADMVYALRTRYPEFPPEHEGEKAQTFTRVLLNTCQNEFESLPTSFEPTEEERAKLPPDDLRIEMKKRKDKMLANMKFIGNLFLRELLAVKVVGQVVHDLIGIKESLPEEHMIECVCELLQAIGHTLDGTQHGKLLMSQFSARLMELKRCSSPDGSAAFSKRIQFQIQDLLDLRQNSWQKKLFKEQAKTKEEVRKDAIAEARKQAKGAGTDAMFATAVAGARPQYIDTSKNPGHGMARGRRAGEIVWDQAYIKKISQYYSEDKNGDELVENWNKPQPSSAQAKQGLEWLMDGGFNDRSKCDAYAETVTELLAKRAVSWEHVRESFGLFLEGLKDMQLDVPHCDAFFHALLARLLAHFGRDFNGAILSGLPIPDEGQEYAWKLFVGAMKKLRSKAGPDAVRKSLDNQDLSQAMCKAKNCAPTALRRHLQEEGCL